MAKTTNEVFAEFPFATADFTKVWGDFKVPAFDVDAFLVAQRKNFEAINAANRVVTEGMKTVAKRQAELIQESVDVFQKASQELASITEVNDRAVKQTELAKVAFEKSLADAKELSDLVSKSTTESFDVVNKRVVEGIDEVKTAIAKFHA